MERLTEGFCWHCQESFPKRIPKVPFGRPLLPFVLSRKVVPAPARGAGPAPAEFREEICEEKILII
ncbi:MAG: hypothetical protein E7569_08770 [Ruminococcaceae bacterium]|nr:hypothetical protein [Oscillospiraceae bacterium]